MRTTLLTLALGAITLPWAFAQTGAISKGATGQHGTSGAAQHAIPRGTGSMTGSANRMAGSATGSANRMANQAGSAAQKAKTGVKTGAESVTRPINPKK
jgi:hypothetical protein